MFNGTLFISKYLLFIGYIQNALTVYFHSISTIVRSWSAPVTNDHRGVTGETVAVKVLNFLFRRHCNFHTHPVYQLDRILRCTGCIDRRKKFALHSNQVGRFISASVLVRDNERLNGSRCGPFDDVHACRSGDIYTRVLFVLDDGIHTRATVIRCSNEHSISPGLGCTFGSVRKVVDLHRATITERWIARKIILLRER